MADAGVNGIQATPKACGTHSASTPSPLNPVQKWLGQAQLQTTAIHANAVGEEERNVAEAMWKWILL